MMAGRPNHVEVRCVGLWRVKVIAALALAAYKLRLIDEARVVTWINAVLARCRGQVRFPGGRWRDLGPVKARLTIAVTA